MVRDFTWYHIDCFTISVDQILQSVSLFLSNFNEPTIEVDPQDQQVTDWSKPTIEDGQANKSNKPAIQPNI